MDPVTAAAAGLPESDLPARHARECISFGQSDGFLQIQLVKNGRLERLRQAFADAGVRKVFLSHTLAGLNCGFVDGVQIETMPADFFHSGRTDLVERLRNCVVIVNNNDVAKPEAFNGFVSLLNSCETTCFAAWDFDNHHWLDLSTRMALHADVYVPAHHENLYLLSRYNWAISGPVYATSMQWSRQTLMDKWTEILKADRSPAPLGIHVYYEQFPFRNRIVGHLNQFYPSIRFTEGNYFERTSDERLTEWVSYKSHWIVPVLNDVPIRVFDALITGGIPIAPASLASLPPIHRIPREHIVFYTIADVLDPARLVERAIELFDRGGQDGMTARHRYALDHHHADIVVRELISRVYAAIGV